MTHHRTATNDRPFPLIQRVWPKPLRPMQARLLHVRAGLRHRRRERKIQRGLNRLARVIQQRDQTT